MQFSLVLALFLGLLAIAFCQEIDEGVLVLTDDNFEAVRDPFAGMYFPRTFIS